VNFVDRDSQNNVFTPLIINDEPPADNALIFVSDPLEEQLEVSGNVSGEFVITINKRDVDITFALYEQLADGRYFFLNRYLGRASYAGDRSNRTLLSPGERTVIPFSQTKLISRELSEGSRLVLVLSVNKHPFEQINYGTGKDVSGESIADAGLPLEILWHADSFMDVSVWQE
jgi:predicted acyl esterase